MRGIGRLLVIVGGVTLMRAFIDGPWWGDLLGIASGLVLIWSAHRDEFMENDQ